MVTTHALERISERTGFRASTAVRFVQNALDRGLHPEDLPCKERDYLLQQEQKAGCIARLYNGCCFIFSMDGSCITMYLAPKWFGRRPYYVGKQRVRDYKKYAQRYDLRTDFRNVNIEEVASRGY